jgi:limonene-1,2-epoxide hydrolase
VIEFEMRHCSITFVVAALCMTLSASGATGDPPTPGEIARKQIDAAAARDWQTLKTLYAPNVRYVDPNGETHGVDAAITAIERTLKPFGKVTVAIVKVYEGKDYAVAEWTSSAINSAEITLADGSQAPPTDNEVNLNVVTLYDIKDGRIVSERNYYDALAMYGSLGLLGD